MSSNEPAGNRSMKTNAPSELVLISEDDLINLQSRPSLGAYCNQLWDRRHFIVAYARASALKTGQNTYLGKAWIFINPLLQVAIYGVVFGLILQVSRGMDNFIGFLMIGVIFFGMLGKGLTQGNGLIQGSKSLIGAFSFPRACLVFSTVIKQSIDDIAPALVAVIGALAFQMDKTPTWHLILVIPIFLMLHIFACGLTFFTCRMTAFIPDLKGVISTFQRGLFFFSGVFYDIDRFANVPVLREIMLANPFYQYLKSLRTIVLDGQFPEIGTLLYISAWSIIVFLLGFVFFWSAEERYANVK